MTNIRVIRVMCSGRIDPLMVTEAFLHGKDGVAVMGCRLGECHYISGNYHAKARMSRMRKLLHRVVGLSPDRLFNDWVSTSEDQRLISLLNQFYQQLKEMGPLGKETRIKDTELKERLTLLKAMLSNERIRWLISKEIDIVTQHNVFNETIPEEKYDKLIESVFQTEVNRMRILRCLKERPQSAEDISSKIALTPDKVLEEIVFLRQEGSIILDKIEGLVPIYREARSD